MKWKQFPRNWSLWREFTGQFPTQKASNLNIDVFGVSLKKNGWINTRLADDSRRNLTSFDATVVYENIFFAFHIIPGH